MISLADCMRQFRREGYEESEIRIFTREDTKTMVIQVYPDSNSGYFASFVVSRQQAYDEVRKYLEPLFGQIPPFEELRISQLLWADGTYRLFVVSENNFIIYKNFEKKVCHVQIKPYLNGKGYLNLTKLSESETEETYHFADVYEDGTVIDKTNQQHERK